MMKVVDLLRTTVENLTCAHKALSRDLIVLQKILGRFTAGRYAANQSYNRLA